MEREKEWIGGSPFDLDIYILKEAMHFYFVLFYLDYIYGWYD